MDNKLWIVFAALAGICWGTYVPFVQQGIRGLERNSLASLLCVGVAYFLIGVLYPVGMFVAGEKTPAWNVTGVTYATLAGVAGALGALCVIYANKNAPGPDYRMYIAPIIFGLAPILNTVVSLIWHPNEGAFHFALEKIPGWQFFVGIILTAAGAFLVLYSKEAAEQAPVKTTAIHVAPIEPAGEKT